MCLWFDSETGHENLQIIVRWSVFLLLQKGSYCIIKIAIQRREVVVKVALIWSSPNKDGLTNSAAMQFKKGLENYGVEVTEIHLNKKI